MGDSEVQKQQIDSFYTDSNNGFTLWTCIYFYVKKKIK